MTRILAVALALSVLAASGASGQESRRLNRIPKPGPLPPGATAVKSPTPIDPESAKGAAETVAKSWNTGPIGDLVSDSYYDKDRFVDAMVTNVPRDTRLRLEAVGGVQTLQQVIVDDPAGGKLKVSTVSVTARTRLDLNDPTAGFLRVPGINEIIFEVIEKVE